MKIKNQTIPQTSPVMATLLLAFIPFAVQASPPVLPGAGTILQQMQPQTPPAPILNRPGLNIESNSSNTEKADTSVKFLVNHIDIIGNTLFDSETLHALVADVEGKETTLGELNSRISHISDYYHNHGYPLVQAILPQQSVQAGVVKIQIIEARYGKIKLDNSSKINSAIIQSMLAPLQSGSAISDKKLDFSLLLLSDIPGVNVNATLSPGADVGTSDLLVSVTPSPLAVGNIIFDNYGNKYTGRARIGGTVNIINPLHHGDVFSANVLSSGKGMNYGRISYEGLINSRGTRIGTSYSALRYVLGKTFKALDAHGTARVASVWIKHPLFRTRDFNLYGQAQYDQLQLRDHIDTTTVQTDRHLDNWTATVNGDLRDHLLSGGLNTWSLSWTAGQVKFDNAAAHVSDLETARTDGGFSKINLNMSRLQTISGNNTAYLSFAGQMSDSNLDSSQKLSAGGVYTVRAYDMATLSADTGYIASIELRHDLGQIANGQWQAVAFIDNAHLTVNKATWISGTNTATLNGLGAGVNWIGPQQWSAKAYIAKRVGSIPALVAGSAPVRGWIEISKSF